MLYNQFGIAIKESGRPQTPAAGVQILPEPADRQTFDISRGAHPRLVDRILLQANGGDVEEQCQLARELPEKNHDIAHALRTRKNTLTGCRWEIVPGDSSPAAKAAAETLQRHVRDAGGVYPGLGRLGTFRRLLRDLSDALLPGFAASEIVWRDGGAGFFGFRSIEPRFFSFTQGTTPRLRVTGNMTDGIELPRGKIVFHETAENGSDPARGGLIRPLAWLDLFSRITIKDFLGFVERYGMPFVVARVDDNTWTNEKEALNSLISNFGPSGGGVFSKNTELELLQAANTTGDVYFRLLEYMGDAITRVILGQTASSKDASGLSGGDAQSGVRQDILESDARQLEDTINSDLFAVWTHYNCPEGTPPPMLQIETGAPEDTQALATTVKTLYDAGLETDPDEMTAKFGFKLSRRRPEQQASSDNASLPVQDAVSGSIMELKSKYDAMGVAVRAGILTPTQEIEEVTRRELRLDPMPESARKVWQSTGGSRQPLTIKSLDQIQAEAGQALEMAESSASAPPERLADAAAAEIIRSGVIEAWLGPLAEAGEALDEDMADAEFEKTLKALASGDKLGDSRGIEEVLVREIVTGMRGDGQ